MYNTAKPKEVNPRAKAGFLSQLFFTWIIPLMYKGCKNGLKEDDLPQCLPDDESRILGDKLEK